MDQESFAKILHYRNELEIVMKRIEEQNKPTESILYMIAALDNALKLLSDMKTVQELIEEYS